MLQALYNIFLSVWSTLCIEDPYFMWLKLFVGQS